MTTDHTPDGVPRISVTQAHALIAAGRGVLVDVRDRRLYDNAHAAGALSLPLAEIDGPEGRGRAEALARDGTLILYCA